MVALLLAISLVFSLPMLLSSAITLLSAFMMVAVILYAFFSNRFYQKVLLRQEIVKHKLRDWVRVNGIVTIIFTLIVFLNILFLLKAPQIFTQSLHQYGIEMPQAKINAFLYFMLAYGVVLFVHVLWTFALLRKNKDHFQ